jgi:hypothetical protein
LKPELKPRWFCKWGRPPIDHYFLTLINGEGPLCKYSIQRLKAECDAALSNFAFNLNLRRYTTGGTQDERGCYVFFPLRQSSSTKRYEGGEQSRLWRWCHTDAEAHELTPESWSRRGAWNPMATPAFPGKILFLSDFSGVVNIWIMNLDGTAKRQLTAECGMDVMDATVDGRTVVYRVGGDLYKFTLVGRCRMNR